MIYDLMGSTDGQTWVTIKSQHEIGVSRPHEYIALDEPKTLRYIKLVNIHMAYNGKFAIRAIRVFGKKGDTIPQRVTHITIKREENDSRNVKIQWQPAEGAERYMVRYGTSPDRMEQARIVKKDTQLTIRSLNKNVTY